MAVNNLHTLNVNGTEYPIVPQKIYVTGSSSNTNYPFVFAGAIGSATNNSASDQKLYTDITNSVYYNPSTNTATFTGPISSTQYSGSWLAGVTSSAVINVPDHTGYGAIFNAPTQSGRMSISTYPGNDNKMYFSYFKDETITAKTNAADKQMCWDGPTNTLIVAELSGNASSATKLKTARTLWGQSFDGSANISGALTDTGNITSSEASKFDIGSNSIPYRYVYTSWIGAKSNNAFSMGANNGTHITIDTSGLVGVGTNAPASRLHVNGLLKITNSSNTVTIGSSNEAWCHFENSADIPFYFNKQIVSVGGFKIYNKAFGLSSTGVLDASDAALTGNLSVTGTSTFTGNTTNKGIAYFANGSYHVNASGAAKFASLTTTGAASIGTTLSVGTNATISGTLGVTGATTLGGTLAVTGASTFTGKTTHKAGISSESDITLYASSGNSPKLIFSRGTASDTLCDWTIYDTSGFLTFIENASGTETEALKMCNTNISTPWNVSIGGTLGVTGATTLSSTLAVTSTSTFTGKTTHNGGIGTTSLSASTSASIGTTLSVGTNATIGGTLGVTGATTLSSTLSVSGTSTFTGNTTNKGIAYFANGTTYYVNASGTAKFASLTTTGSASIGTTLSVGTNATIGGTLGVTGASTFTGKTTHNGGIGTTSLSASSTLSVTGATTLSSTLSVSGTSSFSGHTTHNAGLTVPASQKINVGSSYITYNSTTGCLEITC